MKIQELEDECDTLSNALNQHKKIFGENVSFEQLSIKLKNYDELFSKLRLLLINEESKRGKFNFIVLITRN
jgi:hypothetical protein